MAMWRRSPTHAARRLACLPRALQRRWASGEACVPLERLAHKGCLRFQVSSALNTHVLVEPSLAASDFAMRVRGARSTDASQLFSVQEERVDASGAVHVLSITSDAAAAVATPGEDEEPLRVHLTVPHLMDLSVSVVRGRVELRDKIEGDVKIAVGSGDVVAHKLRGTTISLKANKGDVAVSSLVEGESVQIVADAVACKRAMAGALSAKVAGSAASEFGAIYSSACSITAAGGAGGTLKVGNVHGYLRIHSDGLERVEVDSVSGSLELEDSGDKCAVAAHFDSWADGVSSSILVGGDVRVSVAPSAPLEVELHGSSVAVSDACAFDESELERLDEDYVIFTGALKASADEAVVGGHATGKINVGSAKNDAMRTSFFAGEGGGERGDSDGDDDGEDEDAGGRAPRLLVHATKGQVSLEQLDWMSNLRRKHERK